MSAHEIKVTGTEAILRNMQKIVEQQSRIARITVFVGTGVMAKSCRDAAPGSTKQEVGRFVRKSNGPIASGRVGLMKYPSYHEGRALKPTPHLYYLTRGTKYIAARRYVENALVESRSRALLAMEDSVNRTIETIVSEP